MSVVLDRLLKIESEFQKQTLEVKEASDLPEIKLIDITLNNAPVDAIVELFQAITAQRTYLLESLKSQTQCSLSPKFE